MNPAMPKASPIANDLPELIRTVLASRANGPDAMDWLERLRAFIAEVKAGVPSRLNDLAFLTWLWESEAVSETGNGTVKVAHVLEDAAFRDWFQTEVSRPLPQDPIAAEAQLTALYDALAERMEIHRPNTRNSTPRLKINRVLCALYPEHFTSIADEGVLKQLHRDLGGRVKDHPVHAQLAVRRKVDAVLDTLAPENPIDEVRRVCIPWYLYAQLDDSRPGKAPKQPVVPGRTLEPLDAEQRRKGLSATKGYFKGILEYLPEFELGLSAKDFGDLVKRLDPEAAASTAHSALNVIVRELDLCRLNDELYELTARGIAVLESLDPDALSDYLLTQVLGIDHVIAALRSATTLPKRDLIHLLKQVNPGWTTDGIPSALIGWLESFDAVSVDAHRVVALTERGRRWAALVTWTPQYLPATPGTRDELEVPVTAAPLHLGFVALWADFSVRVKGRLVFERPVVAELHAGLWFHRLRHFAVLTGISGSGKTQLALNYAQALCQQTETRNDQVLLVPVQPAWFDPGPLLGYYSDLQETYLRTPFLELLLRAADDPDRPYVVILDEMNLSHPEQYLAPVLSAMETQGWIDLHRKGEDSAGVPSRVRYPANLAIIGTLNMDETTHGLSDKVLDRAYTLEFWKIDVEAHPLLHSNALPAALGASARDVFTRLAKALAPVRLHFGLRTIEDAIRYLEFHGSIASESPAALDAVVYAKVLPKLRGERTQAFQNALAEALRVVDDHGLSRCSSKLRGMQADLNATGTARFWR